ncbi:HAD-IA family hydrolase [Thermus filiformis]|uniref:Hydrolase n=1 Tax=Thermus filiformis TaxID=276 RepID=A0A0A2X7Y4_THEFI|nr:HAD-IA family hydrolase [Thermus filiformis]KGQ21349.2 hydrolase [Thermus filiformis]
MNRYDVGNTLILASPRFWLLPLLEERGLEPKGEVRPAVERAFQLYNSRHLEARTLEGALALWRDFHRTLLLGLGLEEERAEEIAQYLIQNWQDPRFWPLAPYAREVLQTLRERGYLLAVVSNWDATLPHILEALGLSPYFQHLAVSALSGYAKPDPRLFQEALSALGVPTATHVGDSEEDRLGAEALGLPFLRVDHLGLFGGLSSLKEVLDFLP